MLYPLTQGYGGGGSVVQPTGPATALPFGGFPPFPGPPYTNPFSVPSPSSLTVTVTSDFLIVPTITTILTSPITSEVASTITQLSITQVPIPNPTATAAFAEANSVLKSTATLTRTGMTVSVVLGSLTIVLILALGILLYFFYRRRGSKGSDDESPPFTSLAPRPAPGTGAFRVYQNAPEIPEDMRETSLSMGPRSGTADSYSQALSRTLARTQEALNSHPLTRPSREAPPPPDAVERSGSAGSVPPEGAYPVLQRPPQNPSGTTPPRASTPLYHAALQDQATRERDNLQRVEAERLGLPVIGVTTQSIPASVGSIESDLEFEEEKREEREQETARRLGVGPGAGQGTQTPRVMHSTRASSGVFPDRRDNHEEEVEEVEEAPREEEEAPHEEKEGTGREEG